MNDDISNEHPPSTYELESSHNQTHTPEESDLGRRELLQYIRTPTVLESALSLNAPVKINLRLFENYKVASKLPADIFKIICKEAVSQPVISEFSAEPGYPQTKDLIADIINDETTYNRESNYYRQMWRVFLDNEQLLKEV